MSVIRSVIMYILRYVHVPHKLSYRSVIRSVIRYVHVPRSVIRSVRGWYVHLPK
jgi:hypothetical protein